jgi:MoaA/NifB/PqqE/SkfB family radical SAM enzyme
MTVGDSLAVHIYLTPNCNLRCKHCYYRAGDLPSRNSRLLSIRDIVSIMSLLHERYDTTFEVEGGEPFLRPDVGDLFTSLSPSCFQKTTVTTNGTVPIMVQPTILVGLRDLRVSIEGHTETLQRDVRGTGLQDVLATASWLQKIGVHVTLRVTLHKQNVRELATMIERLTSFGFRRLSFFEFQAAGRGGMVHERYALENDDMEGILLALVDQSLSGPSHIRLNLPARRRDLVQSFQDRLVRSGWYVRHLCSGMSLTVDCDGSLGVCPWAIGESSIGAFCQDTFDKDMSKFVENKILHHTCEHCSVVRIERPPS